MGSATLAHASRRGRVLGIEQFERAHDLGASNGRSRIIRKAYFENHAYVPLLTRAYELWHELQTLTETPLLRLVGVLMVGDARSEVLYGVRNAARLYDIPLEQLDAGQILRRYPGTKPRRNEIALYEADAGVLFPEVAIEAHLGLAQRNGAEVRYSQAVTAWECLDDRITIRLRNGEVVDAARLAICAGPWLCTLAEDLRLPLRVQRNVQLWFQPYTNAFGAESFPAFFVDRPEYPAPLYGVPNLGEGLKAALHGYGETTQPSALDRTIRESDIAVVKGALDDWIPHAAANYVTGKVCMYTRTPDDDFIIDRHPSDARVVIAGGFSGHGYKFCSVVGEIVSQLAFDGSSPHAIDFLRIDRFAKAAT